MDVSEDRNTRARRIVHINKRVNEGCFDNELGLAHHSSCKQPLLVYVHVRFQRSLYECRWAKADYIYILIASTEPYTTPQFNTLFLLTPTKSPCTDTEWHVSLNVSALFSAMSKLTVCSYSESLWEPLQAPPGTAQGSLCGCSLPGLLGSAAL